MEFDGIPREALGFLEHRDEYERHLLEPARDLVVALGAELDRRASPSMPSRRSTAFAELAPVHAWLVDL